MQSFKIEGRLKDAAYVKNVVAHYSELLNDYISRNPERYERSSRGKVMLEFKPNLEKSFNRGFTDYFLSTRRPENIASLNTPKSMGEIIRDVRLLHNGDGISFFDGNGAYQGTNINKIVNNRIIPGKNIKIPEDAVIHRTNDIEWERRMSKETARRILWLDIELDQNSISANDELGNNIRLSLDVIKDKALKPMNISLIHI